MFVRRHEPGKPMEQILHNIERNIMLAYNFQLKTKNREERLWYNGYIEALRNLKILLKGLMKGERK